jgi:hypothetical protein
VIVPRKFLEGLVFGAGFALSFVAIAWVAVSLLIPMSFHSSEQPVAVNTQEQPPSPQAQQSVPQFYELPIEEQIKQASVIGLARFEHSPDGKRKAIFREFLKKDQNATIYYAIGDEYPTASFYPKEGTDHGDGVIVFFVGSPAKMMLSMTYTGDRIHSLGDIPLELFRKKCEKPNA